MKSIDFHICLPGSNRDCENISKLLLYLGFKKVPLPIPWKNSGLQWFRKGGIQVQLIPSSFDRKDSTNNVLQKYMTNLPHIAFEVEKLPTQTVLKKMRLKIIDGPLERPDGLRQLYLLASSGSFFLELNTRCKTPNDRSQVKKPKLNF